MPGPYNTNTNPDGSRNRPVSKREHLTVGSWWVRYGAPDQRVRVLGFFPPFTFEAEGVDGTVYRYKTSAFLLNWRPVEMETSP